MKFKIFISLLFMGLALCDPAVDSTMQVFDAQNAQCTNKCEACQKAIYQMKFHKVADCGSYHCISTCDTVRNLWTQNQFTDFNKDIFGKCDICFRAGFCTITECSDQKQKEETTIRSIVNKSHLTGIKKNIVTELGFDKFNKDLQTHTQEEKKNLEAELQSLKFDVAEGLNAAFSVTSVAIVNSRIEDTVNNLLNPESIYTKTTNEKAENALPKSEEVADTFKGTAAKIQSQIDQLLINNQMTDQNKFTYTDTINKWIQNLDNLLKVAEKNQNSEMVQSINESKFIFTNLLTKLANKPEPKPEKLDKPIAISIEAKAAAPTPKKKKRAQKQRY